MIREVLINLTPGTPSLFPHACKDYAYTTSIISNNMYIPSLKYFIAKADLASSEASESHNIFAGRESCLDIDCC